MLRIGLTGGIATGKSVVSSRFRALGVPVVDADVLARDVVAPGTPALTAIRERFGERVLQPDGALDRQRLADVVFNDAAARRDLEALTHPAIRERIEAFFAHLPPETPFAIADIPLLYETAREGVFDKVIVVACAPALQIERLAARDGFGREAAEKRLAAQLPLAAKVERADYVIWTDGAYSETEAQVQQVRDALMRREM